MQIVVGLAVLLLVAVVAWLVLAVVVTARGLRHPPRRGMAWAIARGAPLTPGEAGWTAEDWTIHTDDGLDLPAWRLVTGAPGPVTIVLHDWAGSRIHELRRAARYLDDSSMVVLFDQRGHGEAPGYCTLADREVQDVTGLITQLGPGPFRLVGHGLGATTALLVAGREGLPLGEVVAVDPWPGHVEGVIARLGEAGLSHGPMPALFMLAARVAGIQLPQVGPVQAGPRVSIQVRHDEDASDLRDRLGREDVEISATCEGTSST